MKPLISIITVCYNSEKTIEDTIESVLNQTYENIEYILVDGRSIDNTLDIIKSYENEAKEKGIIYKWTSEPDKGIYDAMNKGIEMTSGELIGVINSDDWYELDAVEMVAKSYISTNKKLCLIYGDLNYIKNEKFYKREGNSFEFLPEKMIGHPSCFVKKETFLKYKKFNLKYKCAADYDFMLKLFKGKEKYLKLDRVLANFRMGGATDEDYTSKNETLKIQLENNYISKKKYLFKRTEFFLKGIIKCIN